MFLDTERGREAFRVLKAMGPEQPWSFGFRIVDSHPADEAWRAKGAYRILTKLEALEVSPVFQAAGVDTGTVSVKALSDARQAEVRRLVASARRMVQAAERILGEGKALREVDVDPLLGREADELARWAAGRWGLPAPTVKFYAPDARPRSRGVFFESDPGSIWLSAGLRGDHLKETCAHEVVHYAREHFGHGHDEADVEVDTAHLLLAHHNEAERLKAWLYTY
jgi:hypothetical protein